MQFIELLKKHMASGLARILSPIIAAIAMVSSFSAGARSQVVQPMYGVPVTPIVKYGAPPTISVTALPPTPSIASGNTSLGALIAVIITAVLFIVFVWVGLKYFLGHREK
jgi:hypothetical protein